MEGAVASNGVVRENFLEEAILAVTHDGVLGVNWGNKDGGNWAEK